MTDLKRTLAVAGIALGLGAVTAPGLAHAGPCTRLPLSDVAFGKAGATQMARQKLAEYANQIGRQRGWDVSRGFTKSNETVSCEVYLDFGFATEYRCLVTATFCLK